MKHNLKLLVLMMISLFVIIVSVNIGVFWDNILFVSKMGGALYDNGLLSWASIPIASDPGHPPFLATYLALGWKIFGRSLFISHWLMLPFVFGLLWQMHSFITIFIKNKSASFLAFTFLFVDPTFIAQLTQITPEILVLFFFFLALNGTLKNNYWFKIIGFTLLGIVSLRGMMLCAGVLLIDVVLNIIQKGNLNKNFVTRKNISVYILAALPALTYIFWRLMVKGWIISNPLNTFGNAWQFFSIHDFIMNFLKNLLSFGQQFLDFGRIILFCFVILTLIKFRKSLDWKSIIPLGVITIFSTIVIYVTCIIIRSPMGHYYFLPSILSMELLTFFLITKYKQKRTVFIIMISSLLLGNLIVYPDKFAQGWHSSLAHIPYWKMRKNAINYMDDHDILVSETASFFPNNTTIDNIELNNDMRSFIPFNGTEKYVLYSNVFNLSDNELMLLKKNYSLIKKYTNQNVRVEIMQLND